MRTYALIPVKLRSAKTRLADALSSVERAELVKCMLLDVMDAMVAIDGVVIIGPEEINEVLDGYEFEFILEGGTGGLDTVVGKVNRRAMAMGADATLFVPADTPLIRDKHVDEILELGKSHQLIISPSRRGGTGILFRRPPNIINERFTKNSYSDFQLEAKGRGVEMHVYDSFALSLDIDTTDDIREFMLHGRGTRTYDFLVKTKRW